MVLSLVFCIINPLILVAAIANFCTAAVVERYGWIYAYRRWYESGGRLWRQVGRGIVLEGVHVCCRLAGLSERGRGRILSNV
jgi:hypothetical protein